MRKSHRIDRSCLSLVGAAALLIGGCDSGKSGPTEAQHSAPPASAPTASARASGASAPASAPTTAEPSPSAGASAQRTDALPPDARASRPAAQPSSQPAKQSGAARDSTTPHVDGVAEVLELINPAESYQTIEFPAPPNKFTLTTRNVKRLRLSRDRLTGMKRDQSISIQVDEQGIEWLPRTQTIELRRTTTGAWEVAK